MDLEALGIEREQLVGLVVDKIANSILDREEGEADEDGIRSIVETRLHRKLNDSIGVAINEAVAKIAREEVSAIVATAIENTTFQETSRYGEAQKPKLTWREFLADQAQHYMSEQVDADGRSDEENRKRGGSYGSSSYRTTRVAHMLYQYIGKELQERAAAMLKSANEQIVGGLKKAVDMKLNEIQVALTVQR